MDILFDLYLCYRLPSIQSSIKRDQERLIPVINNFGTFNGCNLDLVVNFAIDIFAELDIGRDMSTMIRKWYCVTQ